MGLCGQRSGGHRGENAMELRLKSVYPVEGGDIGDDVLREQNLMKREKRLS